MNKKAFLTVMTGYFIWGFQPLFWNLMEGLDSLFILAIRIIMGMLFTVALLAITKKLPLLKETLRDKKKMRFMIPASILIAMDWGLFIYAVTNGHVLDTSLGYYMSPILTILLSFLLFREKCTPAQLIAVGLAFLGVLISAIQYGRVPVISLALSLYAFYGALKKYAQVDAIVSIAIETLVFSPFALVYLLLAGGGNGGFGAINSFGAVVWLLASGAITAVPMVLYTYGVMKLKLITLGFMQFLSPTLSLLCGLLFLGESLTQDKLISFLFIWVAISVYMGSTVLQERKAAAKLSGAAATASPGAGQGDAEQG